MGQEDWWLPKPRALVERLPDARVRSRVDEEPRLLADWERLWPSTMQGLGLFAQSRLDLHLGSIEGPIIGYALPGAYLPIIEPGPRVTQVVLPYYSQTQVAGPPPPIRAFVESGALGLLDTGETSAPPESTDYADYLLPLSAVPDATFFGETLCGPIHVEGREGTNLRITQVRDRVRISGWYSGPLPRARGTNRCPRQFRSVSALDRQVLPPGYVRVDIALKDPLANLVRRGGRLYWLVEHDDDELACDELRVVPRAADKGEIRRSVTVDNQRVILSQKFEYAAPTEGRQSSIFLQRIELLGDRTAPGSAPGIAWCGDGSEVYYVVAASADSVSLFPGLRGGVSGYHPDDAERWYLTQAACESAAREARQQPLGFARHLHPSGC